MSSSVYLGLVHYPIYNKNNEVIATAVTNFDVHDIARTARTYNLQRYFIIHPLEPQAALVKEITDYWRDGFGGHYNPDRKEAFSILEMATDIQSVVQQIKDIEGCAPVVVTTDARKFDNTVTYGYLRKYIEDGDRPCLILFGTGWGMEKSVMAQFDYILEPIYGRGEYNHLPVRSAVAIILDRLLGSAWWSGKE